jgi:hypothetical protein
MGTSASSPRSHRSQPTLRLHSTRRPAGPRRGQHLARYGATRRHSYPSAPWWRARAADLAQRILRHTPGDHAPLGGPYNHLVSDLKAAKPLVRLAVAVGFEPTEGVNPHTLSRRAPSAARTRHRRRGYPSGCGAAKSLTPPGGWRRTPEAAPRIRRRERRSPPRDGGSAGGRGPDPRASRPHRPWGRRRRRPDDRGGPGR